MLHARAGRSDLSARTWRRKRELYSRAGITFVAVSNWLAEKCRCSPLMDGCRIEVIPNAFPIDEFHTTPRTVRKEAGLPEGRIVLMGAARLDDPVKGLPLAVEALNRLDPASATAVFFGNIRDASVLEKLRMPFVMAGEISDRSRLAELYAHPACNIYGAGNKYSDALQHQQNRISIPVIADADRRYLCEFLQYQR